jgi:hypothetical protein
MLAAFFALTSSAADASDPRDTAKTTLDKALTALAQREAAQSRFSRAMIPPKTRMVRILDESARRDLRGSAFFAFSIDERRGLQAVVSKDALTGCVYPESGEVFIKRGDSHYPMGLLLGKTSKKAEAHVCGEPKVQVAQGGSR